MVICNYHHHHHHHHQDPNQKEQYSSLFPFYCCPLTDMNYYIVQLFVIVVLLVQFTTINAVERTSRGGSQGSGENSLSDAELGLMDLMKTAKNPGELAKTLEMLKDPDIAAEVQAMMQDPSFQAEMKRFTSSNAWKESILKAKEVTEKIADDPVLLKQFESQFKSS
jgi:hypothetical protein